MENKFLPTNSRGEKLSSSATRLRSINILPVLFLFFVLTDSQAHRALGNDADSKTWETKQIDVIRSSYLNSSGAPSREMFLRRHGLFPGQLKTQLTPHFSISFNHEDLEAVSGRRRPLPSAKFLNPDFHIESVRTHRAMNRATPVRDGRVYEDGARLMVGGYSAGLNERPVGEIDSTGRFKPQAPSSLAAKFPLLQAPLEQIVFDPFEWTLLTLTPAHGQEIEDRNRDFLPIMISGPEGRLLADARFTLEAGPGNSSLLLFGSLQGKKFEIARCHPAVSTIVGQMEGYRPELIAGCKQPGKGKVATLTFKGEFSDNVAVEGEILKINSSVLEKIQPAGAAGTDVGPQRIAIDGDFQDWRNVQGTGDPEGDFVSYLYPNPDSDLLEIKVSNDQKHLYLYSRVAGAHGRTGPKGRYYWYAYIDADANPETGYAPTRDDNCYFGVAIGDDCEAQFEFVGNRFVKTFFGFTGVGREAEVLAGKVKLGPSHYSPTDAQGRKRDRYKVEYVNRNGSRFITHDHTEGTSEDIVVALSPDGSEVEMRVEFPGFLRDESGSQLLSPGKKINLAIGAEAASDYYGASEWGADSTSIVYGYEIK